MMASLCFNTFGFKVLHVDEREGTTKAGKADGLQPRTLEVSEALITRLVLQLILVHSGLP